MRAFLMRRLSCQDPKVWMKSVQLNSLNDEGDPQITGKVKFQNNNFFEAKWKDPNIRLYWLPDEGQSITEACSGSSDDADKACEYYDNGRCADLEGPGSGGGRQALKEAIETLSPQQVLCVCVRARTRA